jgi:ribosomal protein S12 methylthiotransferase
MPVQHAADAVLARMNRGYRRADVERLIDRLRAVTGMRIRTTVIVGFPGETSSDFAELLDFIRSIEFDRLGAYAFSYERGTPAAALRPLVPKAVKLERLQAVMELQAKISRRRLRALRGHVLRVLADGPNVARTEWDAPEIDGAVHLVSGTATPGEFVSVEIVDSGEHDLVGRITGRQAAGPPVDISCLANRMQ